MLKPTQPNTRPALTPSLSGDEPVLLQRVAEGDRRAFEQLYRVYHRRLTRFLGQITHRPQLVEEILDDTMLVVWRKARNFNGASLVSTWIFAIAYRIARRALKRASETPPLPHEDVAVWTQNPEAELIQRELQRRLRTALAALSAEHRAVVELTYYHGYAYGEIAQIVGCPVDTVKTRMFHARRRLKALLDDSPEDRS